MNDNERLQLQKLLHGNKDAVDQTDLIRKLKHSYILKDNIQSLLEIKQKFGDDKDQIQFEGMNECSFLFNYYTDIFNKIMNDEIDIQMLYKFIDVLKKIEDNEVDQHEGSYEVGKILKEMYIDSALKKSERLDKEHQEDTNIVDIKKADNNISYKDFKKNVLNGNASTTIGLKKGFLNKDKKEKGNKSGRTNKHKNYNY
tara:strand:+ start:2804 stop:3400 length:597 start_codon:yes stop_codon:yes gene_type:complete